MADNKPHSQRRMMGLRVVVWLALIYPLCYITWKQALEPWIVLWIPHFGWTQLAMRIALIVADIYAWMIVFRWIMARIERTITRQGRDGVD